MGMAHQARESPVVLSIVLQEVMTTNGNPSRLKEWTAMAKCVSEVLS